jgi:hypothetical protein
VVAPGVVGPGVVAVGVSGAPLQPGIRPKASVSMSNPTIRIVNVLFFNFLLPFFAY